MAEGDSPTIARRRVRLALREARESAGLTRAEVAEQMEWSLSKVVRIENGDVSISPNDLRGVLNLLGVHDKAQVDALLADARVARTRGRLSLNWWQEPRYHRVLSKDLLRFIEYEAEASEIRSFAILYVPGPLQTPEYSAALSGMWLDGEARCDEKPEPAVDVLVDMRRKRFASLSLRRDSVKVLVVADESVFRRTIGGPRIFAGQLRHLVRLCELGLTRIRLVPFHLDVPLANNGSFELMTVGSDGEVMYRENGVTDELVENRAETARHRRRFEQLWQVADDEDDTIAFIKSRIEHLEENLPGRRG